MFGTKMISSDHNSKLNAPQQHYKSTYNETHITVAKRKPKLQKCLTIFKPAIEGSFSQTSI